MRAALSMNMPPPHPAVLPTAVILLKVALVTLCTAVAANIACEVGAVHLYNSHTTIEAKQETQLLHVASELD